MTLDSLRKGGLCTRSFNSTRDPLIQKKDQKPPKQSRLKPQPVPLSLSPPPLEIESSQVLTSRLDRHGGPFEGYPSKFITPKDVHKANKCGSSKTKSIPEFKSGGECPSHRLGPPSSNSNRNAGKAKTFPKWRFCKVRSVTHPNEHILGGAEFFPIQPSDVISRQDQEFQSSKLSDFEFFESYINI
jgi:hypothetical protein